MTTEKEAMHRLLSEKTADIVCAFTSNNTIEYEELPNFVRAVYQALSVVGNTHAKHENRPTPAVNPKRSVFPDYIICLEDGKKYKSLKRHLAAKYHMTPDEYREKWGLGAHYPMIAPNYAKKRAELAKIIGFTPRTEREKQTKFAKK